MKLVDPRVVYQLVLFAQKRGTAQFQGEQLLKVLSAFSDCEIADVKAWTKLGNRTHHANDDYDATAVVPSVAALRLFGGGISRRSQ